MSDLSKKEEALLRALNTTTMGSPNYIHEDLSDLITLITPKDTPLFSRLGRTKSTALTHEWTEDTLSTTLSTSAYADGSAPAANDFTRARRSNKIMSIGRRASATELLQAVNTVGAKEAFAYEVERKMVDVIRCVEYWTWNGNVSNTSPQEMDGIINILSSGSNSVSNAGSAEKLNETKLQEAILACFEAGGQPNAIFCSPTVAQRISNFNADKVRYLNAGGGPGGVGPVAMRYLSPLGYDLEVVPVRGDFLPSGKVYILDESQIKYADLRPIHMKELSIGTTDVVADRLIKCYTTLELRAKLWHAVISNVSNSLS